MPAETAELADGLRVWWPLVGAVASQLLVLGAGIEIVRRLRNDFRDHDVKDDKRFEAMGHKLDTKLDHVTDRLADLREDIAGRRHER